MLSINHWFIKGWFGASLISQWAVERLGLPKRLERPVKWSCLVKTGCGTNRGAAQYLTSFFTEGCTERAVKGRKLVFQLCLLTVVWFLGKVQFQKSFNCKNILEELPPGLCLKPLSKQTACAFTLCLLSSAFPLLSALNSCPAISYHRLMKIQARTSLHRRHASSASHLSFVCVWFLSFFF